jgi:hypothetical protein
VRNAYHDRPAARPLNATATVRKPSVMIIGS